MAKETQHVVPNPNGGWSVKKSGSPKATKNFSNQADAENFAKGIAQNQKTELFIHRKDGTVRDRNSYGNDPMPPKDKK